MRGSRLSDTVLGWVRRRFATGHSVLSKRRGPRDHVIILDGTLSTLEPGQETNAGLAYRLLKEAGEASLYYEAGIQWPDWASTPDVLIGRGINRQIRRAYGYLASRYRPGDRIFLLGYSRGAYAVRSLAGMIDRVGLLRADAATVRNIRQVYRLYQFDPDGAAAERFADAYCHPETPIGFILQSRHLILIILASWVNREQQARIEYLHSEVAVLKEHIGKKRILLTDDHPPDLDAEIETTERLGGLLRSYRRAA